MELILTVSLKEHTHLISARRSGFIRCSCATTHRILRWMPNASRKSHNRKASSSGGVPAENVMIEGNA